MLIVDDDDMNREILQEIFDDNFELIQAESGEAALEIIPEFKPDIVLLDVMMNGIDGYEVCKRIKNNPDYASMIVVLVSARAFDVDKQKGFGVGANDFISKPFSVDEIRQCITDIVENSEKS